MCSSGRERCGLTENDAITRKAPAVRERGAARNVGWMVVILRPAAVAGEDEATSFNGGE
jgi:hypothetical protein